MRSVLRAAIAALLVAVAAVGVPVSSRGADGPRVVCRFSDPRLVEISGITWSRTHPGVYWVHNDSGRGPYLYAVDGRTCKTLARIRVANIGARDLEAIATGTDPRGQAVLWLGDIGDNRDSWPSVRLHAIAEPTRLVDQQVLATTYRFTFGDMPHNAEGLIAAPDRADVWVVTKQLAAGSVWKVPLSKASVTRATVVGDVVGITTDAAMSRSGTRFVVRDYLKAYLYDGPVSAATLKRPTEVVLPFELQGEAITWAPDDAALLVAGERETALWWVPLTASSSSPTASPSPTPESTSASASPSTSGASASSSPSADPGEGGSSGVPIAAVVGVALLAGAVGLVVALRRER